MSIYEYDEEKHMRFIRQEGYKEGYKEGRKQGKEKTIEILVRMGKRYNLSISEGIDDLRTYYGLSEEEAQEYYNKYK